MATDIVLYDDRAHRADVIRLWEQVFGYGAAHNAPDVVIDQKLAINDGLFLWPIVNPPSLAPCWPDMTATEAGSTLLPSVRFLGTGALARSCYRTLKAISPTAAAPRSTFK